MLEVWRPCLGWEGLYEVSDQGRVRRTDPYHESLAGRIMLGSVNRYGYRIVRLSRGKRRVRRGVHQLVCESFHGVCPSSLHQAAHKNDCKTHNSASNLYWATTKQNASDRVLNGGQFRGSQVFLAKLSEADIPTIRDLSRSGISNYVIARRYGVTDVTIRNVVIGRCWKHVAA